MRGADLMTWLLCAASALVVSGCSGKLHICRK